MARCERSINMLKYLQFLRLSCNIQTLFYWGRKGELYTNYHIWLISNYEDLKTKVVPWFSLVIGQNANRQLATSSEKLVASVQFLVTLATSESQFRALLLFRLPTLSPFLFLLLFSSPFFPFIFFSSIPFLSLPSLPHLSSPCLLFSSLSIFVLFSSPPCRILSVSLRLSFCLLLLLSISNLLNVQHIHRAYSCTVIGHFVSHVQTYKIWGYRSCSQMPVCCWGEVAIPFQVCNLLILSNCCLLKSMPSNPVSTINKSACNYMYTGLPKRPFLTGWFVAPFQTIWWHSWEFFLSNYQIVACVWINNFWVNKRTIL